MASILHKATKFAKQIAKTLEKHEKDIHVYKHTKSDIIQSKERELDALKQKLEQVEQNSEQYFKILNKIKYLELQIEIINLELKRKKQ